MQDKQTGDMIAIDDESQASKDKVLPDIRRQGVTLRVGEVVDIKGGRFQIQSLGQKEIRLKGMPGTKVGVEI